MDNPESPLNCVNCGMELEPKMEFCPSCGAEVEKEELVYQKVSEINSGELSSVILGGFLILVGLMPFFLMDTSVTGVTGLVRLCLSAGVLSVLFGSGIVLFGVVVPRVRVFLG